MKGQLRSGAPERVDVLFVKELFFIQLPKYGNVLYLAVTPNGHSSISKDPRDYFKAKYSEGMQLALKLNDCAGQNEITISTQSCLSDEVRPNDYIRAIIRTLSQAQAVKWELINILVNEEEEIKIAEIFIDCLEVDTCTASHYIESAPAKTAFTDFGSEIEIESVGDNSETDWIDDDLLDVYHPLPQPELMSPLHHIHAPYTAQHTFHPLSANPSAAAGRRVRQHTHHTE